MQRLGAKPIRVMSYAVCKDEGGKGLEEQFSPERIRRMNEVNKRLCASQSSTTGLNTAPSRGSALTLA